jgi:hypothetical protein
LSRRNAGRVKIGTVVSQKRGVKLTDWSLQPDGLKQSHSSMMVRLLVVGWFLSMSIVSDRRMEFQLANLKRQLCDIKSAFVTNEQWLFEQL